MISNVCMAKVGDQKRNVKILGLLVTVVMLAGILLYINYKSTQNQGIKNQLCAQNAQYCNATVITQNNTSTAPSPTTQTNGIMHSTTITQKTTTIQSTTTITPLPICTANSSTVLVNGSVSCGEFKVVATDISLAQNLITGAISQEVTFDVFYNGTLAKGPVTYTSGGPVTVTVANETIYIYIPYIDAYANAATISVVANLFKSLNYSAAQGNYYTDYSDDKISVTKNYTYYICGAASKTANVSAGLTSVSWNQSIGSSGYSSIGISGNSICTAWSKYGQGSGTAIVGLGVNASAYEAYYTYASPSSTNVAFAFDGSPAFMVIVVSGIYGYGGNGDLIPTGPSLYTPPLGTVCKIAINQENIPNDLRSAVSTVFVCPQAVQGTYELNETMLSHSSTAVYIFKN